jgi:uncharacterized membrane protein YcaP (DUF421 family)
MSDLFTIDWGKIFVPTGSLPDTILRGTITFWFCFLFLRFLRRGSGQLGVSDLLLVTLIADASANGMTGGHESITEGFVLVGTLVFWNYTLNWLSYRNKFFSMVAEAEPRLLVSDGVILPQNLRKELITEDELLSLLRQNGVDDVKRVKSCYLEGSGNVSVIEKNE